MTDFIKDGYCAKCERPVIYCEHSKEYHEHQSEITEYYKRIDKRPVTKEELFDFFGE